MSDQTLEYQPAPPPLSVWAIVSFALSLLGAFTCFLIIPPLVTWAIALIVSGFLKGRTDLRGQGMARAAVHVSGWAFPVGLVVMVLLPTNCGSRELPNRSVCAANLRGIMQSLNVYSADFNDAYPVVSPAGGYSLAGGGGGTPNADAGATMRSMYTAPTPSVTQNMWLLVLTGQVAPKQYICKSDPGPPVNASATFNGNYQTDFNDGSGKPSDFAYSYSFAYPWETSPSAPVGPWWKNQTDAALPLIADMAPLTGTGTPAATPADPTTRNANSLNHQRNGQNVGYGDAHAEFAREPNVGHGNDNIYTSNAGAPSVTGMPFPGGRAPNIGNGGAPGNYDVCLVPAADGTTHVRK